MKVLTVDGRTILFHENDSKIINIRAIVNAGSSNEVSPEDYGVAHL